LPPEKKIGGVILVAGFTENVGYDELKNFFMTKLDFKKIKSHCDNFVVIHSDNDPYVDVKFVEVFKKELGAEVIIKHDMGHFSGAIEDEKACIELPEVTDGIKKLINPDIPKQ
jgi:predicted alpha/beta hydrolase family esterase